MVSNYNPTPMILQPRRYSEQKRVVNMRGHTDASRTSLHKRTYTHGARNEEMSTNEQFFHACKNGDYRTVRHMLDQSLITNIDFTNQLGRTPMQLAIENEHLEVVEFLLEKCDGPKIREPTLLAIYLGHVQIAEACILHPKFQVLNERGAFGTDDAFWMTPSSDDAQFAPDITPLILAAQYNRTEIVQLLLRSGNRITKPHDYHCKCRQCHQKFKFDSLRHAQSRLNAYRGLASESYISLAAIDPILTAFELGRELRDLSGKEKYFKNEYMILADQLSTYAVKLLDKVRGHKELDCVLGKTGKESEEKHLTLARLYLAIKYEEKPFVAHSNCQQKLVEIWHSQIRNLFKLNPLLILLLTILYIPLLPFACLLYILTSWSKYTKKFQTFLKQPCIKFIGHTISYAIFITLIIVCSFLFAEEFKKNITKLSEYKNGTVRDALVRARMNATNLTNCIIYPNNDLCFRATAPTWFDITITIFVVGFIWHEIKQAYSDGFQDYLLSWNNIVDSCMSILYLSSFALKYYVIGQVNTSIRKLDDLQFISDVGEICSLSEARQSEIYRIFYWLNADRFYWVPLDPVNVSEGLFAIANIFSFSRICFLLPAFQHLGPLQISLGRMMSDITKFIIIFLIIFCGFMFGLNNLFWYYKESVRSNVEIRGENDTSNFDEPIAAEIYFGTMISTFKTVFWSLFGLAEKEGVQLEPYDNRFTEIVGYIIYGAFNIASVIVLLNMLIAMMSKSYETIEEHADVEWKFARSKLYMEYIKDGGTLPVPFNIVPTPEAGYDFIRRIFHGIKRLINRSGRDSDSSGKNNLRSPATRITPPTPKPPRGNGPSVPAISNGRLGNEINYRTRQGSFDVNPRLAYRKVMDRVIKRFLLHKQREEQEVVRERDFEELKQDIQMLRFEMLNRLEETRNDLHKNSQLLNEGIVIVGELLSNIINDSNPLVKENFHLFKTSHYTRTDSGIESNASTKSTTSIAPIMSNSSSNIPLKSDLNNSNNTLSLKHVGLQEITEEDEIESQHKSLPYIDDDHCEEVPARHMSIQTTTNDSKHSSKF